MSDKVQLEILMLDEGVSISNSYTVLMQEKNGNRRFVIVIGFAEAQAIATSLEKNFTQSRPLTHDIMHNILNTFNVNVMEVTISDVKQGVFYSTISCKKGDLIVDFDSRTSDALALSLRFKCPIYISSKLLDDISMGNGKAEQKTIEEFQDELDEELKEIANLSDEELTKVILSEMDLSKKTKGELTDMIQSALENEDYELAARIRDELDKRK